MRKLGLGGETESKVMIAAVTKPPRSAPALPSAPHSPASLTLEQTVQRFISISGGPNAPFIFSSDVVPLERRPESNQIPASACDHPLRSVSFLTAGPWPRGVPRPGEGRLRPGCSLQEGRLFAGPKHPRRFARPQR